MNLKDMIASGKQKLAIVESDRKAEEESRYFFEWESLLQSLKNLLPYDVNPSAVLLYDGMIEPTDNVILNLIPNAPLRAIHKGNGKWVFDVACWHGNGFYYRGGTDVYDSLDTAVAAAVSVAAVIDAGERQKDVKPEPEEVKRQTPVDRMLAIGKSVDAKSMNRDQLFQLALIEAIMYLVDTQQ